MTCPRCQRGLSPIDVFCGFCGVRAIADAPTKPGGWTAKPGVWTAEPGVWTAEPGVWTAKSGIGTAAAPVVDLDVPVRLEGPVAAPPPPPAPRPEEPDWAAGAEPAGFWIRGGAFAVDALILAVWVGVVWVAVMGAAMTGVLDWAEPAMLLAVVERTSDLGPTVAALFAGVLLAYLVAFVVFEGATPGKMLFRLRVLPAEGPRVAMVSALAREGLGRLAGVATLGVGFALIAFAGSKRGLHDMIARTRVVRLPEEQPAEG